MGWVSCSTLKIVFAVLYRLTNGFILWRRRRHHHRSQQNYIIFDDHSQPTHNNFSFSSSSALILWQLFILSWTTSMFASTDVLDTFSFDNNLMMTGWLRQLFEGRGVMLCRQRTAATSSCSSIDISWLATFSITISVSFGMMFWYFSPTKTPWFFC